MTDIVFDPTAVDTIDQSSVETTGPTFPIIQWHYGDLKAKKYGGMDYMGGFFMADDMMDNAALVEAGWEQTTWTHHDGSETSGFWKREIVVSVINIRKRWEITDGGLQVFSWDSYDKAKQVGNPSSRLHVLCLVKGLEAFGPIVLTLKGMSAMAFEGVRDANGALAKFASVVIRAANQASDAAAQKGGKRTGAKWPYRAFWLPVGADREGDEPKFNKVGRGNDSSHVVLPIPLGVPDMPADVDLGRFYVGNDLLVTVNELWQEAEENWTHVWDKIEPGATATGERSESGSTREQESAPAPAVDDSALAELGL